MLTTCSENATTYIVFLCVHYTNAEHKAPNSNTTVMDT